MMYFSIRCFWIAVTLAILTECASQKKPAQEQSAQVRQPQQSEHSQVGLPKNVGQPSKNFSSIQMELIQHTENSTSIFVGLFILIAISGVAIVTAIYLMVLLCRGINELEMAAENGEIEQSGLGLESMEKGQVNWELLRTFSGAGVGPTAEDNSALPPLARPKSLVTILTLIGMYTDKLKTIAAQIGDIQKDVVASNAATQRLLHTFKEKQRAADAAQFDYNENNEKTKALLGSLDRTIHEQTFLHDTLKELKKSMVKNAEVFMKSTYEQTKIKMLGPVIIPTSQYGVLEFTYSGSDHVLIESVEGSQKCELTKSEAPKEPGKKQNPKVVSLRVSSALLRQNTYVHLKVSSLTNSFLPFLLPVLVQECFEAVRVKKDGNHLIVSTDITNVWIRCAEVELYCNGIKEEKVIHLTGGRPYALTVKDNHFPKNGDIVLFNIMFARYAKAYSYLWRYVTDEQ